MTHKTHQKNMNDSSIAKPSIVLVHGAFADASSWQKVIALLEKDGYTATAVQNPLKSIADDVATTKRAIESQKGDVVLVGHSYGGAVITGAGADNPKVKALVYVAAFAPDSGETVGALIAQFPATPLGASLVPDSAGFLYIDRAKFHDIFAKDVPEWEAAIMAATQKPVAGASFGETQTVAAWKTVPSWYVVSTQDHAINPDSERFMAKRMGAKTTEIEASHVSFISQPAKIVKIIEEAAGMPTKQP
jgi:pimeloyl-ACP methyl ester carboxylesterase